MKKKCLAIFPQQPFPHMGGDRIKVYHLIEALSLKYDLFLFFVCREPLEKDTLNYLKSKNIKFENYHLKKLISFFYAFFYLIQLKPLQIGFFYHRNAMRQIKRIKNSFDFIFVNQMRVIEYSYASKKPIYFDMVDCMSVYYKELMLSSKYFFKLMYLYEMITIKRAEKRALNSAECTFLLNINESKKMQNLTNKRIVVLENGIKDYLFNYISKSTQYEKSIAFIGKLDYKPNRDALLWFFKNIWYKVDAGINFFIIGANPSSELLSYKSQRVFFTGFITDPYLIMNSCNAIVSPIINGVGIQNKVLEGMALGKINITTSIAISGIIGASHLVNCFIEDEPIKMAYLINEIVANSEKYSFIGSNAKKLVQDKYRWNTFYEKILKNIKI